MAGRIGSTGLILPIPFWRREVTIKRVRKAVFPVAGLGTRFLPATKAMPKEMLTVVDKPLIQYAVEEALEAGIEQIIFVTGRGKGALEIISTFPTNWKRR